jgi:hypothetical protein
MKESRGEYSAFISFASENREKAEAICASLERRGFVCWIAPRDVLAGREYADEIIGGIERSASVVLVLSEAANASVFVDREIERAFSKQKPIFPVRIEPVTPSPSLELFISGTHWLDAWEGDWDGHMARLARDLAGPAGKPITSGRAPEPYRRNVGKASIAAGLALGAVLSGVVIWSFPAGAPPQPPRQQPPPVRTTPSVTLSPREDPMPSPPAAEEQVPPTADAVKQAPPARSRPTLAGSPPEPDAARTSQANVPPPRAVAPAAAAPALETTRALNELRDEFDTLSIRGEAVDDTLNRLWEEMRPLSPRVDMATRQRSLRTYLARTREALTEKDVAQARRYLDMARADLAALEQFLGR